jgi:hypothetical protein
MLIGMLPRSMNVPAGSRETPVGSCAEATAARKATERTRARGLIVGVYAWRAQFPHAEFPGTSDTLRT